MTKKEQGPKEVLDSFKEGQFELDSIMDTIDEIHNKAVDMTLEQLLECLKRLKEIKDKLH